MNFEQIRYAVADGVATITLNRPDALNAITPKMLDELYAALEKAGDDDAVGLIVLTGEGRAFSAGVDLKALGGRPLDQGGVGDVLDKPARAVIRTIENIPKPVIAKVNGFCFTGALELALACDLIYVAEEAKLGDTHAKFGLRPTWGMSQRLPQAVGIRRAKEISFTAATFTGTQAREWGLANHAAPGNELDAYVAAVATTILANSGESLSAYKVLYNQGATKPLAEGLAFEEGSVFDISDTNDRLAEFLKK